MEKKDLAKQQRRKRKDPQSRDFFCKCGKSYLSYAAVYTHVRNKHDGDKTYQEQIKKPQKEKLKRGRPKDRKQIVVSTQTQSLSICQQTTLAIFQQLKQRKDSMNHHIILQGNQQPQKTEYNKQYHAILQKLQRRKDSKVRAKELTQLKINLNEQVFAKAVCQPNIGKQESYLSEQQFVLIQNFIKGVNKHFVGQIAAKVVFAVSYILHESIDDESQFCKNVEQLSNLNIWYDQDVQINKIIIQGMQRWFQVHSGQQANPNLSMFIQRNCQNGINNTDGALQKDQFSQQNMALDESQQQDQQDQQDQIYLK